MRVSLICFGLREVVSAVGSTYLNGSPVDEVFANLTGAIGLRGADITRARPLAANLGVAFSGITKKGDFDLPGNVAREMLKASGNPNARPNSDVLFPWKNGAAITDRDPDKWIIHFGERSLAEAARYEVPFEHVRRQVLPQRNDSNSPAEKRLWWLLARRAPELFTAVRAKKRYIVTPEVSKHRVFAWTPVGVVPDKNLVAIARDDDVTFGILTSRFHAVWALRLGSSLEDRPRYTSSTTFRTFPFPLGMEPSTPLAKGTSNSAAVAIENAAKSLNDLRERWLNPPEWVERTPEIAPGFPDRLLPRSCHQAELKKRTLTNLYNSRPAWLEDAHRELDRAVAAGYGWEDYTSATPDDEIIARLLRLNLERTRDLFTASEQSEVGARELLAHGESRTEDRRIARNGRPSPVVTERRLAVLCTLVNRLADEPHFGRTKMAKLFYLADITQDLDLDTNYYRQAAGPLDAVALYDAEIGLEALAIKHRYLSVEKTPRKITYRRGPDLEKALESARTVLGKNRAAINKLIDLFRPLDTDQCEIVATLYACWNDRLLDQKNVSDESVIEEFLGAWHEKKRRFSRTRLLKALKWMTIHHLVPTGRGSHTQTIKKA